MHDVTKKAKAKIWSLLKLREAGASSKQLLDLYLARVRSTLEYGAPVFGPLLNGLQSNELEAVQRRLVPFIKGQIWNYNQKLFIFQS